MKQASTRRVLILAAIAVATMIAVVGIRVWIRGFDESVYRYKVARRTNAVVVRKDVVTEGDKHVIFFRIPAFAVMNYRQNKVGEWTQAGLDTRASDALTKAEFVRDRRNGLRHHSISKQEYDNIEIGENITVIYRLEANDTDIEIIAIETVPAELKHFL